MDIDAHRPAAELSLKKQAESFLGAVGAILLLIYALGFLILSLYDAKFGIVELDPFRARILATGVTFVGLLVLPVAALRYGFTKLPVLDPIMHPLEQGLERQRKSILLLAFIYTAWVMATFLGLVVTPVPKPTSLSWLYSGEFLVALLFFFVSFSAIVKRFPTYANRCVILALLSTLLFALVLDRQGHQEIEALTAWFCVVGVISFRASDAEDLLKDALHWWNWLVVLLCVVFYASSVFGGILPRYGGGAPTPIVLYLKKPLPWATAKINATSLLDETDQGYFVAGPQSDSALFVPRSDVSAIYFGPPAEAPKAR